LHKGSCNITNVKPAAPSVSSKELASKRSLEGQLAKTQKEIAVLRKPKVVVEAIVEEGADTQTKEKLATLRNNAKFLRSCVGPGFEKQLEDITGQIRELEAQVTQGKPWAEQSKIVQSKLAKERKGEEATQETIEADTLALAALSEKIDRSREKLEEHQLRIQDLTSQANVLNDKMAGTDASESVGTAKDTGDVVTPDAIGQAFAQQGLDPDNVEKVKAVLAGFRIFLPAAPAPPSPPLGVKGSQGGQVTEPAIDPAIDPDGDFDMEWQTLVADGIVSEDSEEKKGNWIKIQQKKRKTAAK
jgi:hypothetical protein